MFEAAEEGHSRISPPQDPECRESTGEPNRRARLVRPLAVLSVMPVEKWTQRGGSSRSRAKTTREAADQGINLNEPSLSLPA